jgi:hypothetical protein
MGPVEVVFLILIGLFGAIGVVRGWQRELGVTTMLLLALFVIEFVLTTPIGQRVDSFLTGAGVSAEQLLVLQSSSKNSFLSLMIGLLNGYLFAGSIWYYMARAGWPLVNVVPDYSQFYKFFVQILPPQIFGWQFFILVAVAMLILRVVR